MLGNLNYFDYRLYLYIEICIKRSGTNYIAISNKHLADLCYCSFGTITQSINRLKSAGLIRTGHINGKRIFEILQKPNLRQGGIYAV